MHSFLLGDYLKVERLDYVVVVCLTCPERGKRGKGYRHKETLGGDECIHYLDTGDVFTGLKYVKMYQNAHFKYVQLIVC